VVVPEEAGTHRPTRTWRPFTAVRISVLRITDYGTLKVFDFRIEGLRVQRGPVRRTKGSHYAFYSRLVVIPLDVVLHGLGVSDVLEELEHWERRKFSKSDLRRPETKKVEGVVLTCCLGRENALLSLDRDGGGRNEQLILDWVDWLLSIILGKIFLPYQVRPKSQREFNLRLKCRMVAALISSAAQREGLHRSRTSRASYGSCTC